MNQEKLREYKTILNRTMAFRLLNTFVPVTSKVFMIKYRSALTIYSTFNTSCMEIYVIYSRVIDVRKQV